jgi:hypothetical protein
MPYTCILFMKFISVYVFIRIHHGMEHSLIHQNTFTRALSFEINQTQHMHVHKKPASNKIQHLSLIRSEPRVTRAIGTARTTATQAAHTAYAAYAAPNIGLEGAAASANMRLPCKVRLVEWSANYFFDAAYIAESCVLL